MRLLFETKFMKPVEGTVGSKFDEVRGKRKHKGVDIPISSNTPIKTPLDGKVITSVDGAGNCGGMIEIEHELKDGSTIKTKYCHLNDRSVQVGDQVSQGDVIGKTGGDVNAPDAKKGNSQGPHLHFEVLVKKGNTYEAQDPELYFDKNIETVQTDGTVDDEGEDDEGEDETNDDLNNFWKTWANVMKHLPVKEQKKATKRLIEQRIVEKLKNKKTLK